MLEQFLSWWGNALVPPTARRRLGLVAPTFEVSFENDQLLGGWTGSPHGPLHARSAVLKRVARRRARVLLHVPQSRIVTQRRTIPARVLSDLDSALRLALPTITPFEASELFWHYRVLKHDRAHRKIEVAIHLAPRAAFAAEAAALQALGLRLDGISGAGTLFLLPASEPVKQRSTWPARLALGGVLCNVIAGAYLAISAERDLRYRAQAAEAYAMTLRERLSNVTAGVPAEGQDPLAARALEMAESRHSAVEVLAALTQALPDDAFATRVVLRDGTLSVSGSAVDAAVLVPRLGSVEGFGAPSFAGPVRTDRITGREEFRLALDLEGRE